MEIVILLKSNDDNSKSTDDYDYGSNNCIDNFNGNKYNNDTNANANNNRDDQNNNNNNGKNADGGNDDYDNDNNSRNEKHTDINKDIYTLVPFYVFIHHGYKKNKQNEMKK